jgi:MOSC domain-containing protein YiiM
MLAREDLQAALDDLAGGDGAGGHLGWTARRANLLVEGVRLRRAKGARLAIGEGVELEVTGQTVPCGRMEEAYPGLLKALYPEWRGGVTCRVLSGGAIATGDRVVVTFSPPEVRRKLPG